MTHAGLGDIYTPWLGRWIWELLALLGGSAAFLVQRMKPVHATQNKETEASTQGNT